MAVKYQYPYEDEHGVKHENLIRYFSNKGKYLVQIDTGKCPYSEAIDVYPSVHEYKEMDIDIPSDTDEEV